MAQGKEWNKEEILRTLEPFFKVGCNLKKACDYAGIPYTTVHTWVSNDEELRIKITAWQNEVNMEARKLWIQSIKDGDVAAALQWLTKKEKDEFSDRKEITGAEGEPLFDDETKRKSDRAIDEFLGTESHTDGGQGRS